MNGNNFCDQWADAFLRARDSVQHVQPLSQIDAALDLDRAYQVGRVLHERLVTRGFRSVGRKIGFTNPAMWERFKVSQPIWAHTYAQTVHHAPTGSAHLSLDGMVAPRLEPEIVLKLRRPIPSGNPSVEDLVSCVEWAAIGFEIVDSHYPEWRFTAAEAVADFGVHAALVVGAPWSLEAVNPREVTEALRSLKVTLRHGNETFAEGEGRNALGSPLLSLGFLARVLATQPWAPSLSMGEIITTGTLTPLPVLHKGDCWRVRVEGAPIPALELKFE